MATCWKYAFDEILIWRNHTAAIIINWRCLCAIKADNWRMSICCKVWILSQCHVISHWRYVDGELTTKVSFLYWMSGLWIWSFLYQLFCAAKLADNPLSLISYDKHFVYRMLSCIRRWIRRDTKLYWVAKHEIYLWKLLFVKLS